MFTMMNDPNSDPIAGLKYFAHAPPINAPIIANMKFANGPAKLTIISPKVFLRKFLLSIGTGFAQPKITKPGANNIMNKGIITVPNKSICASGFRVSLP